MVIMGVPGSELGRLNWLEGNDQKSILGTPSGFLVVTSKTSYKVLGIRILGVECLASKAR